MSRHGFLLLEIASLGALADLVEVVLTVRAEGMKSFSRVDMVWSVLGQWGAKGAKEANRTSTVHGTASQPSRAWFPPTNEAFYPFSSLEPATCELMTHDGPTA
jgi:hypothetical protein